MILFEISKGPRIGLSSLKKKRARSTLRKYIGELCARSGNKVTVDDGKEK
jgi:hypothetical protein